MFSSVSAEVLGLAAPAHCSKMICSLLSSLLGAEKRTTEEGRERPLEPSH